MVEIKLVKIQTEDSRLFYLLTEIDMTDHSVSVLVSDGLDHAWSGVLLKEDTKNMDFQKLRSALTVHSEIDKFRYTFVEQNAKAELTWKVCLSETVKCKLGSIKLTSADPKQSISKILDWTISNINKAENDLSNAKHDCSKANEETERCMDKLEKCTKDKEDTETFLYAQFSKLINAKKEKIRSLKAQLERKSGSSGDSQASNSSSTKNSNSTVSVPKTQTQKSEDEEEFKFNDSSSVEISSIRRPLRRRIDKAKNEKEVVKPKTARVTRKANIIEDDEQDAEELIDEL